jgi:hypothetical protein
MKQEIVRGTTAVLLSGGVSLIGLGPASGIA